MDDRFPLINTDLMVSSLKPLEEGEREEREEERSRKWERERRRERERADSAEAWSVYEVLRHFS